MRNIEDKLDSILDLIKEGVQKGYFPGAAAVIGHRKGVYGTVHYGNRCSFPEELPLYHDTLFDLASLTKVIATTTLFMKFVEKGMISAFDRVGDYVETFKGSYRDDITLLNLLTHTSGLAPHVPFYTISRDLEDAIGYMAKMELEFIPGEKVLYSDLGFILLGYILEKLGGDRLDRLCERHVFTPLGMTSTGFNPQGTNFAATEIDSVTARPLTGICHDENGRFFGGISGHAGLFSNIDDLALFADMLINEGRAGDKQFLSFAAFRAMTRSYTVQLNEDRAYGWCVRGTKGNGLPSCGDLASPAAFGHTGFTGTSLWVDIENNVYVVLLTNRVHPTRENTNILRFRRLFHNAVMSQFSKEKD